MEQLTPKDFMIHIIEDDRTMVEVIRHALGQEGFLIEASYDGMSALDKYEEVMPDLLIVDMMLPKLSGYEFISRVRTMPEGKTIPIVIITGRKLTEHDIRRLKYELNVNEIILKPFAQVTFVKTIYDMLNLKKSDKRIIEEYKQRRKIEIEKSE